MIRAIAVDDEPPALDVIQAFCAEIDFVELERTFTKPSEALRHLAKFPTDLLFLDINMPSITGLEFFKKAPPGIMVVFTTAYADYAVQGFDVGAVDYLVKPFTFERFKQAVHKAHDYQQLRSDSSKTTSLFLRADYSLIKVELADIVYVEGVQDYVKIHLKDQKPLVVRMTMKAMCDKLPAAQFVRVHRSFIVPLSRIASVRNKMIDLQGVKIPIGPKYEAEFYKFFNTES
jgi:DNA-binding LytR/AlgR family response regulator